MTCIPFPRNVTKGLINFYNPVKLGLENTVKSHEALGSPLNNVSCDILPHFIFILSFYILFCILINRSSLNSILRVANNILFQLKILYSLHHNYYDTLILLSNTFIYAFIYSLILLVCDISLFTRSKVSLLCFSSRAILAFLALSVSVLMMYLGTVATFRVSRS